MKIILTAVKPRNPLVAITRFRRSGSHQAGIRARRQEAGRLLKRELDHMKHSP